jgi:transposase
MPEGMRWVGLDVHARETASAVFDGATGEVESRRYQGRPDRLEWLVGVERPFRAVYEPGPTGYGLARRAGELGLDVRVCALGHIARKPSDRVKTDKRDALRLARLLAAGDLTLVAVPPVEHERLRDLVRCREDVRRDLMRVRHRIDKFLLRRELYYPRRSLHPAPPRLARLAAVRGPGLGALLRRLPARPRHAAGPPRRARPGAGGDRCGLSLHGDRRPAALPP